MQVVFSLIFLIVKHHAIKHKTYRFFQYLKLFITFISQVYSERTYKHRIRIHRRATRVGAFEVFEAAHVALRTLLAFSQPVNCIFWPIGMLNWLVAASKLHKHRVTCCTAEWPFYVFLFYATSTASMYYYYWQPWFKIKYFKIKLELNTEKEGCMSYKKVKKKVS